MFRFLNALNVLNACFRNQAICHKGRYQDYLRVGLTVQVVYCKWFSFCLAKVRTRTETFFCQGDHA